jgi:hypothetical protein
MSIIEKLTPRILKKIIAEEKRKLMLERGKRSKVNKSNNTSKRKLINTNSVIREVKLAKVLKKEHQKAIKRLKIIIEARKLIKKKLLRKL